ncbi:IS3 family transposase [Anseongella ginsenosidimutans]|nr:IS3 family transposase [Anseongella ginsenosidimutans]QEC52552.1 IS3 family transposase [Anseongella ginsenosidimutans]QEC53591.1 IS3 family transposase [Anseongella ginsenosidimutans]QEC53993.1 IS3 family transposase [Anseongella ginsenosidimutans]
MSQDKQQRQRHIDKAGMLSIVRQCELLEVPRSSFYYKPLGESELNLELMRLIDEEYLLHPWLGVPRMTTWLRKDKGYKINPKRIERLYRLMGLSATGPKPNTSKKGKGALHRVYKYLLKGLKIVRPNQAWAMDITYIPVQGGYLYLCAIIDLYSRYVVGWSLSNAMSADWCKQTLQGAIARHGCPEILNTDQGSQFTAYEFCDWVTHPERGIKLSMDGKGRAIDNIFIERLWRSVKYEHVYLFPASDGLECYRGLQVYFEYYNTQRRHQSLDDQVPLTVYGQALKQVA